MTATEEFEKDLSSVRQKADEGNLLAQYVLGLMLAQARPLKTPENFAEGISWLERAAQGGYAQAAAKLGHIYKEGKLTAPDLVLARKWYEKAASLDPAEGLQIARCYRDGIGGPVDLAKAVSLFQAAADSGNSTACLELSHAYSNGLMGFTPDSEKAREYTFTKHEHAKKISAERRKKYQEDVMALIPKRSS